MPSRSLIIFAISSMHTGAVCNQYPNHVPTSFSPAARSQALSDALSIVFWCLLLLFMKLQAQVWICIHKVAVSGGIQ